MNAGLSPNVLRPYVAGAFVLCLIAFPSGSLNASESASSPGSDCPLSTRFGALPTSSVDTATAAALQGVVDDAVEAGYPDAIAAIVTPRGTWTGAAGVDGPDGRRATPNDVFAIASITKTFTAALILRLVDHGDVDLDKPLADYLGTMDADANGSTVEQALAGYSGMAGTAPESFDRVHAAPEVAWTAEEVVAAIPPPTGAPGAEFFISNPAYKLLGVVAENVTGSPLYQAMRDEVLDPADSPNTLLMQNADTATPEPWALPTTSGTLDVSGYGAGGALPSLADATFSIAAAGMAGDAPSLAAWAWQLFAGTILSDESLCAMTTMDDDAYGLGMEDLTGGFGPATAFGHGGTTDGYQSLLAIIPDQQAVIVVFVNQNDIDLTPTASRILDASGA